MSYSVIIVDDERNICSLIKNEIEWDALDLRLADIFHHSGKALDYILAEKPDIVITDIQMPEINGLELIERVQSAGLSTTFIIISGYSFFEYAKQAVRFGVDNYILKPIDHGELNDSLDRIRRRLDSSSLRVNRMVQEKMDSVSLRDYFVNSPSTGTAEELFEVNRQFHFHFRAGLFRMVFMRIDYHGFSEQAPITVPRINGSLQRNLGNICSEFHLVSAGHSSCLGILNYPEDSDHAVLRGLQYIIRECNNDYLLGNQASLTIGTGAPFRDLAHRQDSAQQARALCDCRLLFGTNRLAAYETFPAGLCNFSEAFSRLSGQLSRQVIHLSRDSFLADCRSFLENSEESLRQAPLSLETFDASFHAVLQNVLNLHSSGGGSPIGSFQSYTEYESALMKTAESMFREYENTILSKEKKIVHDLKEYIGTHLSEPLDLDTLSHRFFLSAGYLSQLFKSETGTNITAYITGVRMNAAKELLLHPEYTIANVADQLGYNDAKYFSRIFRHQTGISPNEFRKIHKVM